MGAGAQVSAGMRQSVRDARYGGLDERKWEAFEASPRDYGEQYADGRRTLCAAGEHWRQRPSQSKGRTTSEPARGRCPPGCAMGKSRCGMVWGRSKIDRPGFRYGPLVQVRHKSNLGNVGHDA